ncbi:MAG: hypothetical protein WA902_04240 [Thermosynechococcaceae cyanobacterium]
MTAPTPELARLYLGNISTDAALEKRVHQALHSNHCLEVALNSEDRRKGRIYTQAISGESIGIVKDRSWSLAEGDVLQTEAGKLLLVYLKDQCMIVLNFTGNATDHALALVHLGHTLGNHHYPISIHNDSIYIPVTCDRKVIESTINSFNISGLVLSYEQQSPNAIAFSHPAHASHNHHHEE